MNFSTTLLRLEILTDIEARGLDIPRSVTRGEDPRIAVGTYVATQGSVTVNKGYSPSEQRYNLRTKDHL